MRNRTMGLVGLMFLLTFSTTQAQKNTGDLGIEKEAFTSLKWRNIGPFRGGRSNAVVGLPNNDQVYFAGYTGGGIWKTSDAGITWKNISDGFFATSSVGDIAIAKSDPNVIYVGMGEHAVRGVMTSYGDGVYKSLDGGQTWKHIGLPHSRHISDIAIHPSDPNIVWVAVQGALHGPSKDRGIYKSNDGGETWNQVLYVDENSGASSLSLDSSNPRILYASMWDHRRFPWKVQSGGSGSGIYKSTDGGLSWTQLKGGLPVNMGKSGISVSPADPQRVYAIVETEKEKSGLYRSDNGGQTWKLFSNNQDISSRSWYYMEVFADPVNIDKVVVLNAPMMQSIDGGKTFTRIGVRHGDTHDLWINPNNPDNMILGDDGGAEITFNNGRSWSLENNQPTAQFYRVNTDQTFPYKVYGGQQDNSSVVIASRTNGIGITESDWTSGPGCESAFIAFDPKNPVTLFGGCYQGIIEALDTRTNEGKDIRAYPSLNLANYPKDLKYRFNWNAPIVASPHDPTVLYHGGNILLKSVDGGISWEEISPDLTRNDTTKQLEGGGPFTNEGAGGENYNTLSYVIESSLEPGVIYTGSDCGLVYLTRDNGTNWENITPKDLPESLIHSIEVSPHDPGTAYITATRYKFNDMHSYTYKTENYGKSWKKINLGISNDNFLKVIREDLKVPGLLYGGSEHGFYVSFNGGTLWEQLQLNLPIVPITDLKINDNDLVAATAGRAFWIFDDLAPFQGMALKNKSLDLALFVPKPTVRFSSYRPSWRDIPPGVGANPMNGVLLNWYLSDTLSVDEILKLEILNESGAVIRVYSNKKDTEHQAYPGGPSAPVVIPSEKGINRFAWDFRTDPLSGVNGVYVYGSYAGGQVAPGNYKARLTLGERSVEQDIQLLPDPRVTIPEADWKEQQQMLMEITNQIEDIHQTVEKVGQLKLRIQFYKGQLEDKKGMEKLVNAGDDLLDKLNSWEANIIEKRTKNGQDVINWPSQLNVEFFNLKGGVDGHFPKVTEGVKQRFKDLSDRWEREKIALDSIMNQEVNAFNQLFDELNIRALMID